MKVVKLFFAFCAIPIFINAMENEPSNFRLWKQIDWQEIDPCKFTLANRLSSIKTIVDTLSLVNVRIIELPFHDSRKEQIVHNINRMIRLGNNCLEWLEYTPEGIVIRIPFNDQKTINALIHKADAFLDPYHDSENILKEQVEQLAHQVERQDEDGVGQLLDRLNQLTICE